MRHAKRRLLNLTVEFVLLLSSMIIIVPIMIMVLGSLKTSAEADAMNLSLPSKWMFENYVIIFQQAKILQALFNSVFVTTVSTIIVILTASLAAFVITRSRRKLAGALYNLFLFGITIPPFYIAEVFVFKFIHVQGTYAALILHYAASGAISLAVFMYTGFMKAIPREIDESAFVEGCGSARLFYSIILPLLQPVTITILLIISMNFWNEFVGNLYFLSKTQYWTLPMTIYNFFGLHSRDWNLVFADLIVTLLPITIVFFVFQKYIISGMTAGALKG